MLSQFLQNVARYLVQHDAHVIAFRAHQIGERNRAAVGEAWRYWPKGI